MQEDVQRLCQEVTDIKKLVLQLTLSQQAQQAAAAPSARQPAVSSAAVDSTRKSVRPKASVLLDLPDEEHDSSNQAVVQQRDGSVSTGAAQDTQQPGASTSSQLQPCNSSSRCITPHDCDAAVHVRSSASHNKQEIDSQNNKQHVQQWRQQHPVGQSDSSWLSAAAGCREVDMLAARVHASMDAHEPEVLERAGQQAGPCSRLSQMVLKPLQALLWDMLLPGNFMLLVWDCLMLIVIIYLCIALPFSVAFTINFMDLSHPMTQLDLAASILFMNDCWMNFRTAFVGDDGTIVKHRRAVAVHYLQTWFLFDLISSLPYEQILAGAGTGIPSLIALLKLPRLLRLLKALRLLKLLRVAHLAQLPNLAPHIEWLINSSLMQLAIMCAAAGMLLHWIACTWYYVAVLGDGPSWVKEQGLQDAEDGVKYVTALYWSLSTVATVGFGDIVAVSVREKVIAIVAMFIGAAMFGYVMGAISMHVAATNSHRARLAAKRRAVNDFLTHRRVPKTLATKVKRYYDYVTERELQSDEADIIAGLSANLRTQVVLHIYQEALEKVAFFRGQHPFFITQVVTMLQLEYYAPGDIVARQGDVGDSIMFLASGCLEVRLYEDEGGCPLARPTYIRSPTKVKRGSTPTTPAPDEQQQGQQHADKQLGTTSFVGRLLATMSRNPISSSTDGSRCGSSSKMSRPPAVAEEEKEGEHVGVRLGRANKWTFEDELKSRQFRHLGYLHPGQYFGDHSCLLGQERSATVVATTFVEVYTLTRQDLETVLLHWPELAEQFEAMVSGAATDSTSGAASASPLTAKPSTPVARWSLARAVSHQQAAYCSTVPDAEHQGPGSRPATPADAVAHAPEVLSCRQQLMAHVPVQASTAPSKQQAFSAGHPQQQSQPCDATTCSSCVSAQPGPSTQRQQQQQQPMDWSAQSAAAGKPSGRTIRFASVSASAGPSVTDTATLDFPSLAVHSMPPSTRQQQPEWDLARSSTSATRARSIGSSSGRNSLSRVSAGGQTGAEPRYLFPSLQRRTSMQLSQPPLAEGDGPPAAGPMQRRQGSLSRRSAM